MSERGSDRAVRELRGAIEALADGGVELSATRLNAQGAPHAVIMNGFHKDEGVRGASFCGVKHAAADSLILARIMREQIKGPARLFWRVLPEVSSDGLYLRFSFAPITGGP